MCGRYSMAPREPELNQIHIQFRLEARVELDPKYNIAPSWGPGAEAPIVWAEGNARRLELARWWMIPSFWSKPLSQLPTAFNARSEELSAKNFWSDSFESRRCLVPATGWREFSGQRGARRPYHFHFQHAPFAFAGLYDEWRSPAGETVRSYAIVTVAASDVVRPIHDRMPLCAMEPEYDVWLNPREEGRKALDALLSAPRRPLETYESDPVGNDVRCQSARAIAPARMTQLALF